MKGIIWNDIVDFSKGYGREHWINENLHFPIVSRILDVNII